MKTLYITLSLTFAALVGFGQAPTQPQKKTYTLAIQVDSVQYVNLQNSLVKVANDLNASKAPHDEVTESINLIKQLYDLWSQQKKEQDKVVPVKQKSN